MSSESSTILLDRFTFCHVRDTNTGTLTLHDGPKRIQLSSHERLVGEWPKICVRDGQFAIVLNPYDSATQDILEGERQVRVGPSVFSLYPGERLLGDKVNEEIVLSSDDALLLRAEKECPNPLNSEETITAGTEVLLRGTCRYIPHKDIKIVERRKSISLAEAEGIYVQNDDTGEVRLVKGPADFFLAHNESLWSKRLTREERQSLGYEPQSGVDGTSRVLATEPRPREKDHQAVVIDLEDNEVICLFQDDKTRVEFGPQTVFLQAHERPKVLFISGGVPVRPNVLRIAKLGLGPDFIRDRLTVRTRDNATLELNVTYRWVFRVDRQNAEAAKALFSLKDFVGFAAQTLSAEIREEAAKYDFEKFHSEAADLVKHAVFGATEAVDAPTERIFIENGLVIFGVDVEGITPADAEIANKLADAIKANVDIYTTRVREEAQLASERRLIDGRALNEKARAELLRLELENERTAKLERAQIEADAQRKKADGDADIIRTKASAECDAEESRLKAVAQILESEGGKRYITLRQAEFGQGAEKVFVVPTDSRVNIGVSTPIDQL